MGLTVAQEDHYYDLSCAERARAERLRHLAYHTGVPGLQQWLLKTAAAARRSANYYRRLYRQEDF